MKYKIGIVLLVLNIICLAYNVVMNHASMAVLSAAAAIVLVIVLPDMKPEKS